MLFVLIKNAIASGTSTILSPLLRKLLLSALVKFEPIYEKNTERVLTLV